MARQSKVVNQLIDGLKGSNISSSSWAQYKSVFNQFDKWVKDTEGTDRVAPERLHSLIQEYVSERAEHCAASTLKRDLAALCSGTRERMDSYDRPRNDIGEQTKGREHLRGVQRGYESLLQDRTRLVAPYIGCRLDEYAKLRTEDVYRHEDGRLYVHVIGGKGGKDNAYLVEREHEQKVIEWSRDARGDKGHILSLDEARRLSHANLHECRRERVQDLYERYVRADQEERKQMDERVRERYLANPVKAREYERVKDRIEKSPIYHTQGSVRRDLEDRGLPLHYDRAALIYASVMTAHYREHVIVDHYMR